MKRYKSKLLLAIAACAIWASPASAQDVNDGPAEENADLLELPLEDLLSLESTSVAKKRQRVNDSAAAVYVVTQDDIRNSSATSIPDLLRAVPGLEVGEQQNGRTVVAVRGFKSIFSNSLLVMVDGRSIYVSTLSGVFWDQLLIPLSDIERIEIVRGPGATLWGANAVNGVINIITKHSGDALGIRADARVSTKEQEASVSFGDRIGDNLSYRVSGSIRHDNGPTDASGIDLSRRWMGKSAMARVDWEPDAKNAFTVQTEYSDGDFDFPFGFPSTNPLTPVYNFVQAQNDFQTSNILARWAHRANDDLDFSLQTYYDVFERIDLGTVQLSRKQVDADFGLRWKIDDTHEINAGINGRVINDSAVGRPGFFLLNPERGTDRWISGYIQDDITLIDEKLRLTIGTKLEQNNVTGFEIQPSAKLFFRPSPAFAIWGGVSRAVRTPSRFERASDLDLIIQLPNTPINPSPLPIFNHIAGNPNAQAERLIAYEAGFRWQINKNWSADIAAYYNDYDRLATLDFAGIAPIFVAPIPFPVALQSQTVFANSGRSKTWGAEALLRGNVTSWWKTEISYSHFNFDVGNDFINGQPVQLLWNLEGSSKHTASITNDMEFGDRITARTQLRYVGELFRGSVPDYFSLDVRFNYRLNDSADISLIGENLLSKRRVEFIQPSYQTQTAYAPRSVAVQARVRF